MLGHTSAPPDSSDYVDVQKAAKGYFDTNIMDLEGPDFDELGVLDAIVQQVEYLSFSWSNRPVTIKQCPCLPCIG